MHRGLAHKVCVEPVEKYPKTTGEKIRYYRHLKGMTQEQLATATGFFRTTIFRYENGQSPCDSETDNGTWYKAVDVETVHAR
jgi:DNA-binding XRE family transcriptional regulator